MLSVSVYVLWQDDDPTLGSKLFARSIKLFTNAFVVNVNICRHCTGYTNGDVSYKI
jgi:hypothetical protein